MHSCEASPKINNVRDALERLRLVIQPELKKLNPNLNGKVSFWVERTETCPKYFIV